jgi:AraC-like DNA-binding protein
MSGVSTRVRVDTKRPAASAEIALPILQDVSGATGLALHDTRLRQVVELIESGALLTVHDLAVKVNLSPSYLQHLFKEHVGVCMTRLLAERRLQKAARLLAESDMSIKQIAFAVGYEHASSFVRAFQHRFAQTPRAYRTRKAGSANTTADSVNSSPFHP